MKSLEKQIQKIVTLKNLALFFTMVYCLGLLPVLWVAKYNFPSADDYTNGAGCYQAWNAAHSLSAVLKEAAGRTMFEYTKWRGCFTSSFLSALPPNIWGERWYGLTTLIIIVSLTVSVLYFMFCLLNKVFKADKYRCLGISMPVLILLVQCLREEERTDLLYWYSGAINYAFIFSLELFFLGLLIKIARDTEKKKRQRIFLASVLGFLVGGGNQMPSLNTLILVATAIFFITIFKKWKRFKALIIPFIFCITGTALSYGAPGNMVRAQGENMMSPLKAIFVSFYYCLDLGSAKWITWTVILMVAVMIPVFWEIAKKVDFKFPCPMLVLLYGYCITSAMFTPSLFALGNIGAGRIQGLAYWVFILALTLSAGYITGWARKKYEENTIPSGLSSPVLPPVLCWWILGFTGFLGFTFLITVIPEPYHYTATSAVTDMINGTVQGYFLEQESRIEMYKNGAGKDIVVMELENQPELLFFNDISDDPGDWINLGVARYYNLNSVSMEKRKEQ
ncbi:DUF6056 family protein [Parablautia intestinalis]|uniref:DUF6056 family protein n=1 Tax=Parablautia intestinalis TaxID=2320100 RepID=UPI00256F320B|nr:DUF6056 family protein [Parablautia intestinalis]